MLHVESIGIQSGFLNRFGATLISLTGIVSYGKANAEARQNPKIFDDCLSVLRMDYAPSKEIHDILGVPGQDFEALAED